MNKSLRPGDLLVNMLGRGQKRRAVDAKCDERRLTTTAIDLARKLTRAMHENRLFREMKNLTRPKRLIIDEVDYLKLE